MVTFLMTFPMRKKSHTARLQALLVHRIHTQVRTPDDSVAIQDLTDALIHSREGRTVHGHT